MAERTFDLDTAERLLPQLESWLQAAIHSRKRIAAIEADYAGMVQGVSTLGGRAIDVSYWIGRRREEEACGAELRNAADEIETLGCLVKDLDIGLIDFPCQLDGREVYLCWKLGESSIGYWHNTDEGMAGRKPIDDRFTRHLRRLHPI